MTLPSLPAVLHKQLVILIDQQQRKNASLCLTPRKGAGYAVTSMI